ncbi:carboxypeptidase regulatory-like domain-containing protein [Granulicella cerasi]|uniref:Carboxypeptidase regulatory-like domain-containing protein n=1 Tax=Granulicella cerasi TaxID=741063 RepID=A0ABW1ZE88_9BACT
MVMVEAWRTLRDWSQVLHKRLWVRLGVFLGALLTLGLLAPATVFAQGQNTGTISGNVKDPQGAAVANAEATLFSVDEQSSIKVKVNGRGEYLFPTVKPGRYTVTVSAPAFQNYTGDGIVINAGENIRFDAALQIGAPTETITVDTDSATVDTRSATVAAVIDPVLVQNLPVDGNNVVSLAALLPGVTDVSAPTTFTSDAGGPSYISSGSRANQNLFQLDGMMWNNVYYNSGLNFPPPFMLQEVSVQLVNFKAQYGRNVGSVFNAITSSGTTRFHGTVWEYIQNQALNASDYLSHTNPHLVQNQFGMTLGGPAWKDKAYFFVGVQDLRSSAEVISNTQLPTAAERGLNPDGTPRPCVSSIWAGKTCASFAGDYPATTDFTKAGVANPFFKTSSSSAGTQALVAIAQSQIASTAATAAGQAQGAQNCYDDLNNLVASSSVRFMPNAEIPSECFNPVTQNLYKKYIPIPTQNGVPVTVPTTLPTMARQPRNDWDGLARADVHFGQHALEAKYYVTSVNDVTANSVSPNGTADANYNLDANSGGIISGNVGDTWAIRPNLLNIFRAGYKRYNYNIVPIDTTTLLDLGETSPIQAILRCRVFRRTHVSPSALETRHGTTRQTRARSSATIPR